MPHVACHREIILQRAQPLKEMGATLRFFPLVSCKRAFNQQLFWNQLLQELRDPDDEAADEAAGGVASQLTTTGTNTQTQVLAGEGGKGGWLALVPAWSRTGALRLGGINVLSLLKSRSGLSTAAHVRLDVPCCVRAIFAGRRESQRGRGDRGHRRERHRCRRRRRDGAAGGQRRGRSAAAAAAGAAHAAGAAAAPRHHHAAVEHHGPVRHLVPGAPFAGARAAPLQWGRSRSVVRPGTCPAASAFPLAARSTQQGTLIRHALAHGLVAAEEAHRAERWVRGQPARSLLSRLTCRLQVFDLLVEAKKPFTVRLRASDNALVRAPGQQQWPTTA